jgi:hypothetical protein
MAACLAAHVARLAATRSETGGDRRLVSQLSLDNKLGQERQQSKEQSCPQPSCHLHLVSMSSQHLRHNIIYREEFQSPVSFQYSNIHFLVRLLGGYTFLAQLG